MYLFIEVNIFMQNVYFIRSYYMTHLQREGTIWEIEFGMEFCMVVEDTKCYRLTFVDCRGVFWRCL